MAELFHVGLTVSDLDVSVAFYRDVVGMEIQSTTEVDSDGFRRLTNNSRARLRTALMGAGTFQLQLVQYLEGGGRPLEPDHHLVGAPHLSFWCSDVRALRQRLVADGGVRVTSEIESVVPGIESFYVGDPDGVPVEFIERFPPAVEAPDTES